MIDYQQEMASLERKARVKTNAKRYVSAGITLYSQPMKGTQYSERTNYAVKVQLEVFSSMPETSGKDLQTQLKTFAQTVKTPYNKSCEEVSESLFDFLADRFPNRDITIDISDSNSLGSITFYSVQGK